MNERKLKQLFASARKESSPAAPEGFDADVMRAIRREPILRADSITDQLVQWFPRLALAAGLVIIVCVAGDFALSAFDLPGIDDGVAQLSNEWVLTDNGLPL